MQEQVTELQEETKAPVIDEAKIKDLQEKAEAMYNELSDKAYAISMDKNGLSTLSNIINDVEWKGKEALGVLEVGNKLNSIASEGIKNNVIFMSALEIEASHYFLSKYTAKGKESADNFMKVYKSLDQALINVRLDNKSYDELTKELSAAQQGLVLV
jgi:hypothetical protein